MILPNEISADDSLARRVLVRARSIAPCLDTLEGEPRLDAIAVLQGVVAEIPAAGSRRVKSRSRNGTSISYADAGSWFDTESSAGLKSLCAIAPAGLPIGSFPVARPVAREWIEGDYS